MIRTIESSGCSEASTKQGFDTWLHEGDEPLPARKVQGGLAACSRRALCHAGTQGTVLASMLGHLLASAEEITHSSLHRKRFLK